MCSHIKCSIANRKLSYSPLPLISFLFCCVYARVCLACVYVYAILYAYMHICILYGYMFLNVKHFESPLEWNKYKLYFALLGRDQPFRALSQHLSSHQQTLLWSSSIILRRWWFNKYIIFKNMHFKNMKHKVQWSHPPDNLFPVVVGVSWKSTPTDGLWYSGSWRTHCILIPALSQVEVLFALAHSLLFTRLLLSAS